MHGSVHRPPDSWPDRMWWAMPTLHKGEKLKCDKVELVSTVINVASYGVAQKKAHARAMVT